MTPWWFCVVYAPGLLAIGAIVMGAAISFDRELVKRYGVPSVFDPDQRPLRERQGEEES